MKAAAVLTWLCLGMISVSVSTASAQSPLYAEFISPASPAVPSMALTVKPGVPLQITGFATGPGFQGYVLEWAMGDYPTPQNWSTAGITLAGDGLAPVNPGVLGTWTPPADVVSAYTLRLTVNNGTFFSVATTIVYSQVGLLSSAWPKFVGPHKFDRGAQPVRQPDGTARLLVGGLRNAGGSSLTSYGADGSAITVPLDVGGEQQAAVGDLDGQPGDEVVVSDGLALKIFSSDLTLLRTITAPAPATKKVFWVDQHILADIDGDGAMEIIAVGRDTDSTDGSTYRVSSGGYLYAFRVDGTLYSNTFPVFLAATISNGGLGAGGAKFAAADLNGDGLKEIVVAMDSNGTPGHTLRLVSPNGLFLTFATPTTAGWIVESVSVADLDHDGTNEVVIAESSTDQSAHRIRVLNNNGTLRPGWPVAFPTKVALAIGDLDRDQRQEIVEVSNGTITALRDDGSAWGPAIVVGSGPSAVTSISPLIADVDGDGFPEIIVAFTGTSTWPVTHNFSGIAAWGRDGTYKCGWSLYGTQGRQPSVPVPTVGDFDGDGKSDFVVQVSLIEGGGQTGATLNSALTWFTPGTNFNAAASDWVTNFRDPQNSRRVVTSALPPVPLFSTQPQSQTVTVGSSAVFTAAAVGNPAPTYQWQKNGVNIAGATGPTLTLGNVQLAASGTSYRLVASNSNGPAYSDSAVLTVVSLPVFTKHPISRTVNVGANVTFTAAASGTPAPVFYWQKNGAGVDAPPSPSLVLTNVQLADAGTYQVVAMNTAGSVSSNSAALTVNAPPVFTLQPPNTFVALVGLDVPLTVEATGTPAPTYRWQKNGANITGATSPTLTLTNIQLSTAGTYRAIATNAAGSATSISTVFTVVAPPVITKQPVNKTVTAGANVTLTVAASGTPAPTFQWQKDGIAIDGATSASLVLTGVQLGDSAIYTAIATNQGGSVISNGAVVTVNELPVITTQPTDWNARVGDNVFFFVGASGTPAATFRWQKNGVNIAGATDSMLTLNNVGLSAAGTYRVIATNAAGSATSVGAVLKVSAPPVITSQTGSRIVNPGATTTFSVTVTGTPAPTFQWFFEGSPITGATSRTLTLVNAQSSNAGVYWVMVTNVAGTVYSDNVALTVNSPPTFTTQPSSQEVYASNIVTFYAIATGIPEPTYQWQKNGVNISGATSSILTLPNPTLASAGTYRAIAKNAAGSTASADALLTVDLAPTFTTQPVNKTVNADTNVTFTAAVVGFPAPTFQWQKNGQDIAGATSASLTLNSVQLADAGSFQLIATNVFGPVYSNAVNLVVKAKPVFVTSPESQSVSVGGSAIFQVEVTGFPTPSIKWQKNGVNISGATGPIYIVNNVQLASSGATYTAVATNSLGVTTSTGAVLTVVP